MSSKTGRHLIVLLLCFRYIIVLGKKPLTSKNCDNQTEGATCFTLVLIYLNKM